MAQTTYESISTKQTLNRVKEERMPFDWSINPYRGCGHGCSFCYARAFQSFIGMGAEDEFQHHIFMKTNAAEALAKQLSDAAAKFGHDIEAMRRSIGQVTIGTATDPYQPIEGKAEITRECLKLLAKYRISTSITTRSPLVLRDMDILTRMEDVSVNISLNTLDADLIRKLEPASPHPASRLEAVWRLSSAGIRTGVFAAPVLPYLTDGEEGLRELLSRVKEHGASFAMISLLRLSRDVKKWYMETLKLHFPEVVQSYRELYRAGAYAEEQYVRSFKMMAARLLSEYGLEWMAAKRTENPSTGYYDPATGGKASGLAEGIGSGNVAGAGPHALSGSAGYKEGEERDREAAPSLSTRRRKLPEPAAPVSAEELKPEVEQLSFPF
ncbi:SPL family radical SAM protein [Paenibacillus ihbetae]|uniref:Radical SAM protein n=1 Tax=Paenibacillus ihbetae TaxID=1870820 RepID=A0A1B2E3P1_9BACL|nr:radical SAM protein [Paenibacillus ihbetae]ANY74561.1 radical SAM protein [Paenibacillus ihbetae]OOC63268.1 radical SAM protein [Paenibacillus ihbetae]